MRKINLCQATLNHQFKYLFLSLTGSKYGLSLKEFVFFFNTLILLYFLSGNVTHAQYYNQTPEFLKANSRWAFGQGSGLEFSSGTAVPWQTSVNGIEGYATVSDPNTGNLIFYTNGGSVWNRNHQVMPNGTGLMGNSLSGAHSAIQGSLIVPFISGNDGKENQDITKYYVFSLAWQGGVHADAQTGKRGSLFYNVVDMSLDNGNGDVDTNYKNIVLDTGRLSEALIAIPGCNNDIWVLTHSYDQVPQVYMVYHITENGLDTVPVISQSRITTSNLLACMAVSPNRERIGFVNLGGEVELSNIDLRSGTISNSIIIPVSPLSNRAVAFSPDNNKLYASGVSSIFQYDISIFDSATIVATQETIGTAPFAYIRLFNDSIYVVDYVNTFSVHRINQPNNPGVACNFQQNAITLSASNNQGALGNDVVFAIPSDTLFTALDTIICAGWEEGVILTANDTSLFTAYTWSTGDTTSSIEIDGQGVYWVKYRECNQHYIDTFRIRGSDLFTTITVNGFELGTTGGPFVSYQWYLNGELIPGATNSTHTVTENGDYTVEITDSYGCVYLSDVYEVTNVNIQDLQQLADAIRIYPNPASETINIDAPVPVQVTLTGIDGKELIKTHNGASVNVSILTQGIYFLTVADMEGQVLKVEKIIKQ